MFQIKLFQDFPKKIFNFHNRSSRNENEISISGCYGMKIFATCIELHNIVNIRTKNVHYRKKGCFCPPPRAPPLPINPGTALPRALASKKMTENKFDNDGVNFGALFS